MLDITTRTLLKFGLRSIRHSLQGHHTTEIGGGLLLSWERAAATSKKGGVHTHYTSPRGPPMIIFYSEFWPIYFVDYWLGGNSQVYYQSLQNIVKCGQHESCFSLSQYTNFSMHQELPPSHLNTQLARFHQEDCKLQCNRDKKLLYRAPSPKIRALITILKQNFSTECQTGKHGWRNRLARLPLTHS